MTDHGVMETTHTPQEQQRTRLTRPREGRVLGGVAVAVANRTGSSVALIRLGFLVAAVLGGFGIVLYLAAWALTPDDDEEAAPAERWLRNLTTPGKRLGAFLIGIAALIVLAGATPGTILAAVVLLAAASFLVNDRTPEDKLASTTTLTEEN